MEKINNPWQCGIIVGADSKWVFTQFLFHLGFEVVNFQQMWQGGGWGKMVIQTEG